MHHKLRDEVGGWMEPQTPLPMRTGLERGEAIMEFYRRNSGLEFTVGEDTTSPSPENCVYHVLVDLMHYALAHDVHFAREVEDAERQYKEECASGVSRS